LLSLACRSEWQQRSRSATDGNAQLQQRYSYAYSQMLLGAAGSLKGQDYVKLRGLPCRHALPDEPCDGSFRRADRRGIVDASAPVIIGGLIGNITLRRPAVATPVKLDAAGRPTTTG